MDKISIIPVILILFFFTGNVFGEGPVGPEINETYPIQLNYSTIGDTLTSSHPGDQIPVIIVFKNNRSKGPVQAQSEHAGSVLDNGGSVKYNFHVINGMAAELPGKAIEALSKHEDVLYIEQDVEVFAHEQEITWGVERVNAPAVHSSVTGRGIRIAVIDSGIDYNHPDLDSNYKGGYDFVNSDSDPIDDYGHGTKVSGIIAAENNNLGVLGVAPEASLYALKVLDSTGSGRMSNVIKGIEWAVDNDMDIISMSLGGTVGSSAEKDAVDNAYNSGVLVVASAGNYGSDAVDDVAYPAKYDSVIAVSAIDSGDNLCSFSSVGPAVELAAPGRFVTTTSKGGGYQYFSGTSASAPFVTGVAALMMARDSTLTNANVRRQLQQNADDLGALGRDNQFGYGVPVMNIVSQPLTLQINMVPNPIESEMAGTITVHVDSSGTPVSGASVTLTATAGTLNPAAGVTNSNGDFTSSFTAPTVTSVSTVTISASTSKTGYVSGSRSGTFTVNPSSHSDFLAESPHPYPNNYDNTWTVTEPGAGRIRVHFPRLETESGFDFVYIYDRNNVEIASYNGIYNNIWSPWSDGDTIKVRLVSDFSVQKFGFTIDQKETSAVLQRLDAAITVSPGTLLSGQTANTVVHVTSGGSPVSGARVDLAASSGTLVPATGITDINGDLVSTYTAPAVTSRSTVTFSALITKAGYTSGSASSSIAVDPPNNNLPESLHPYPNSYDKTWTITEPGARQMRIHFSRLETESGFDFVYLYDRNDVNIIQYTGTQNNIWSPWVEGDTIKVRLKTDWSVQGYGFIVDQKETGALSQLETTLIAESATIQPLQNTRITVHVSGGGSPVAGAAVQLSASRGSVQPVNGITNSNGDFVATFTAPDTSSSISVTIGGTASKTGFSSGSGSAVITVNPASTNIIESAHPYSNYYDNTWTITEPGARQMRIHFLRLETESGFDFVDLYDRNDVNIIQYTGTQNNVWSPWVEGDTIKVRLKTDWSVQGYGFIVDQKETGALLPHLETTLTPESATIQPLQNTRITVHVSGGGSPVPGAAVQLSASQGNVRPVNGITNSNGDFVATFTAPDISSRTSVTIEGTVSKTGYSSGAGSAIITVSPASTNIIESFHPYPNSYDKTWTITEPGARQMRIHFSRLETESGFDFVYLYDRNDVNIIQYTGTQHNVWSPWVEGDTIKVRLQTDWSVQGYGIIVDQKESVI